MNQNDYKWIVAEQVSEEVKQKFPEMHPVLLQLLWNRQLKTQEEIDVFLGPDWSRDIHASVLFTQMNQAVNRIFRALEQNETITIHGDYDADGVCGNALLISCLRDLSRAFLFDEACITSYIPHREKEGYGLSLATIQYLHEHKKTKLLITVDCGISNKAAIDRAKELGIETIVCDHHAIPDEIPTQAIIFHPLVVGETYPNKNLCGTGVAFKLACGLYEEGRQRGAKLVEGCEKWLLDLVAIATVTDMVPLIGENRVLEKFGLFVLNKTRRIGLQKLIEVAGSSLGSLDTTSIGFQIGPRLNAAGRINHATEALDLLLAEDEIKATELAMRLQETNRERQRLSAKMYEEVKSSILSFADSNLLVAFSETWSPGLVGLVAGKLVNEFHRPAYVIGKSKELYVGSGRTFGNFDVTSALHHASAHLEKFGGHPQACGFSIRGQKNLQSTIDALRSFAEQSLKDEELVFKLFVEQELSLAEIDWSLFDAIELCRPFGQENPEPVFCSHRLTLVSFATVGNDSKHLKLLVRSKSGKMIGAIAFGLGGLATKFSLGQMVDIAFHVRVNEWNGNRELQLNIVSII